MIKNIKQILKRFHLFSMAKKSYHFLTKAKKNIYNRLFPTAKIILYHRIANPENDPHLLSVSPENLYLQLKFLKENFSIVPLVQIVRWIRGRKLKNKTVAITFDDGYADNLHHALPILKELNIPATVFVTAGNIVSGKSFYWDVETPEADRGRPMTGEELKKLANCHLIEIGAHTMSHPKLKKISQEEQEKEIQQSKEILEKVIGMPLLSFAYPFGGLDSFDNETINLVKKSGFHYACANIHERVTNRSDIYALPRYVIRNWNLEKFKEEFNKFI
ncbi:MAG: polysaccharide deacetylase family protein [bacterium]|nr:polysaccharide deacetylase family protein [bacterium]